MKASCLSSILLQCIAVTKSPSPRPANMLAWERLKKLWDIQQLSSCAYPKPSLSNLPPLKRPCLLTPEPCKELSCVVQRLSHVQPSVTFRRVIPWHQTCPCSVHLHMLQEQSGVSVLSQEGAAPCRGWSWSLTRAATGTTRWRGARACLWSLCPLPKCPSSTWVFCRF